VGHVNRLLYGFISKDEITANMAIYSLEDSERSLGKITSVAIQYDSKQSIALGYLRRGAEDVSFLVARDIDSGRESSIAIRNSLSPF
jgi:glycine cleavage system aminomethyltransferase T